MIEGTAVLSIESMARISDLTVHSAPYGMHSPDTPVFGKKPVDIENLRLDEVQTTDDAFAYGGDFQFAKSGDKDDKNRADIHFDHNAGELKFKCDNLELSRMRYPYGDMVIDEAPLHLPRSDVLEYSFVLRPLAEIAPELVHPVTGRTMLDHWQECDTAGHPMTLIDVNL